MLLQNIHLNFPVSDRDKRFILLFLWLFFTLLSQPAGLKDKILVEAQNMNFHIKSAMINTKCFETIIILPSLKKGHTS